MDIRQSPKIKSNVSLEIIEKLVKACTNFQSDAESYLILAIQKYRQKVVRAFLEGGASVRGTDQNGRSALEVAVLSQNGNII